MDPRAIEQWALDTASPWAILGLFVLGILTGRFIVPKFYYLELKADRDEWRSIAKSNQASVAVFAEHLPDALEVAKTTDKVMTTLGERAEATK
jgi:hypothetical protein